MRKGPEMNRKVIQPGSPGSPRAARSGVCLLGTMLLCAGCSRAPSINILGSFFPSWILCGVVGILLTVGMRLFFLRVKLEQQLSPLILVYPCLAAFFTFTLWLIFFR
jgi:YtcA family